MVLKKKAFCIQSWGHLGWYDFYNLQPSGKNGSVTEHVFPNQVFGFSIQVVRPQDQFNGKSPKKVYGVFHRRCLPQKRMCDETER